MFLSSDVNRAYCDFLLSVIPEFEKVNVFLQSGAPQVHLLREVLSNLLREIMSRFVKPSVIKKADVLADIDYKSCVSQRSDEDIVIGSRTTQTLQSLKIEEREEFFYTCKKVLRCSSRVRDPKISTEM
uniref:Hat8 sp n=1 Tax=Rhipicephalus zambeziensis TaxID=60191 RepID=A0A224YP94_9ACAR